MRDLFGQVPVTLREISVWLYRIPRLHHIHRLRTNGSYARNWHVIDKICRAKLEGSIDEILGDCRCEFCGQLLDADHQIPPPPVSPTEEIERLKRRISVLEMVIQAQAATEETKINCSESLI